ncbi:MAG: septum site-determining protein MinC [Ectothiorhodospiraceae bacterium]|jgi:septum site-determining protein MinC|nr:septum site-determining protein MinC [Ectothiorhodospiraceae bacterium]
MSAARPVLNALEFKGRMLTVTVLRALEADLATLIDTLDRRLGEGAEMLRGLPMLLDLEALPDAAGFDLAGLVDACRSRGLSLIGVRDTGDAALAARVRDLGLSAVALTGEGGRKPAGRSRAESEAAAPPAPMQAATSLLITQPVRSGQQVYARGGDLVVVASVSPGAEVLADGNIHIYGALRGRALAGVQGNAQARIFCRSLDPELISIAGHYRLSEQVTDEERGRSVQVRLDGETLRVEPL